jgi:acetylornithine deacetylase/succinyl-diaminopimelate desuccinylase-like protein
MGLFGFGKYKTLSHAVLAGDTRAARKILNRGADPNRCDPDDDAYPIHYALNHGPEMVQLLVDHGANVNIPSQRNHAMPLAFAESHGYTEVAAILRKAGARLRTGDEELGLDPRLRLQIEPKIRTLVPTARIYFPTATPEVIAARVEEKLNLEFPQSMSPQDQERIRKDVRALIKKECGVKDYLKGTEPPIPSPEDVMAKTGMSEHELTRRFMEHLIQAGKDPFAEMSGDMLSDAEEKFPDLVQLARRKFGPKR